MSLKTRLDALTGLRALAAIWVIFFHIEIDKHLPFINLSFLSPIAARGYLGVDLFFILSGFIISLVYHKKMASFNARNIVEFLMLRLARIMPVHYVMLLMYLGIFWASNLLGLKQDSAQRFSFLHFIYNLLNMQAWGIATGFSWNTVAWSISAEWFAYLMFPLLSPVLFRGKGIIVNLLAMTGLFALLCGFVAWINAPSIHWAYDFALVRVMIEFPIGCCLFNIYQRLQPKNQTIKADSYALFCVVALITGMLLRWHDLMLLPLITGFLFFLSRAIGPMYRFFASPPMVYIGEISFSLYMVHEIIKLFFAQALPQLMPITYSESSTWLVVAAILGVSMGAANILYRVVETPCRVQVKQWIDSARQAQEPIPVQKKKTGSVSA